MQGGGTVSMLAGSKRHVVALSQSNICTPCCTPR